jgi:hypothetical protein
VRGAPTTLQGLTRRHENATRLTIFEAVGNQNLRYQENTECRSINGKHVERDEIQKKQKILTYIREKLKKPENPYISSKNIKPYLFFLFLPKRVSEFTG